MRLLFWRKKVEKNKVFVNAKTTKGKIHKSAKSFVSREDTRLCPLCNHQLEKSKITKDFESLKQKFHCKKCNFNKEIILKV